MSVNLLAPRRYWWLLKMHFQSCFTDWYLHIILCQCPQMHTTGPYKLTLIQVMAWCHQATSHYLSQCWPRSISPYGISRPQWVNIPIYEWSTQPGDFSVSMYYFFYTHFWYHSGSQPHSFDRNISHTICNLFCFAVVVSSVSFSVMNLPISFRVDSLALG